MKITNMTWKLIAAASLVATVTAVGCSDDEGETGTTTAVTVTSGGTTTGDTTTGNNTTTGGDSYVFSTDTPDKYKQIDRHGAVEAGTVGIAVASGLFDPGLEIRDGYNADNPESDAEGKYVDEITKSVTALHAALDDDLTGLKLVPATVAESLAQAAPVLVPDTIKYDPSKPTSYPNGRGLEDQVIDITLAAALLKLSATQPLDLLAKIPVNPGANDVAFKATFPFLADPHAP